MFPLRNQIGVLLFGNYVLKLWLAGGFSAVKLRSVSSLWGEFAVVTAVLRSQADPALLYKPALVPSGSGLCQLPCNKINFPTKPPD